MTEKEAINLVRDFVKVPVSSPMRRLDDALVIVLGMAESYVSEQKSKDTVSKEKVKSVLEDTFMRTLEEWCIKEEGNRKESAALAYSKACCRMYLSMNDILLGNGAGV